ncbi:MAG: KR domain-containing protein, partial [Frankia sp.]
VRTELGPITGVIHGAGVLADGYLADKTDEQFAAVFDTKVEGLRALLDATRDDPLSLVCVFSSVAGRFGNAGQSDYAMANEVIGHVAGTVARARPDCVVRSLAWGPWDGGMVSPELRDHFRRGGTELIPMDAGAQALVREVEGGPGPVRVTLVADARPDSAAAGPDTAVSASVRVSAESHPYLLDHAPAGPPVVPLAQVLEWFLAAARVWCPDAHRYVLRDLAVLRRVDLDRFLSGGQEFVVRGRTGAPAGTGGALRVDLLSAAWGSHYNATVGAEPDADVDAGAGPPARVWLPPVDGAVGDIGQPGGAYRRPVLFHGPAFQSIEAVQALSADGAAAAVGGVRSLGWPGEVWHTDPAAIDACLQLALLWAEGVQGAAFLPMSVAEVRVVPGGPVGPGARCVLRAGDSDRLAATCDLALLAADSTPVAELLGVSLVRRPDPAGSEAGRAM